VSEWVSPDTIGGHFWDSLSRRCTYT